MPKSDNFLGDAIAKFKSSQVNKKKEHIRKVIEDTRRREDALAKEKVRISWAERNRKVKADQDALRRKKGEDDRNRRIKADEVALKKKQAEVNRKMTIAEGKLALRARTQVLRKKQTEITYGPTIKVLKDVAGGLAQASKVIGSGFKTTSRSHSNGGSIASRVQRHDASVQHAAERKVRPDPYNSSSARHEGGFNVSRVDSSLAAKVARTKRR
jgi:hypothetical protein